MIIIRHSLINVAKFVYSDIKNLEIFMLKQLFLSLVIVAIAVSFLSAQNKEENKPVIKTYFMVKVGGEIHPWMTQKGVCLK